MNHRFPGALALLLLPVLLAAAEEVPLPAPPAAALDSITVAQLHAHLQFIASDLMGGRETATVGARTAAAYLASQLERIGLEPMGDRRGKSRGFTHSFPLRISRPLREGTRLILTLSQADGHRSIELIPGQDFHFYPRGIAPGQIEAPLVFAGHGIVSEEHGIDDYRGLDVRGKIALIFDGHAAGVPVDKRGRFRPARFRAKRRAAEAHGVLALLVVHAPGDAARLYSETMGWARRAFERSSMRLAGGEQTLPMLYLEDWGRDFLGGGAEIDSPANWRPAAGARARFTLASDERADHGENVVGWLPGSDPELGKEVILYSAHYDHLGAASDGGVYNGADDNASGTCTLLEIAEAFAAAPRPRRTVAFLFVSGEEKGLLGSKWFSDHNTFPAGHRIVADINIDMVGRNDSGSLSATPSPQHEHHSTLNSLLERASEVEGYETKYDIDGFYRRSDHYNFARQGIPVIFLHSGLHPDYHKVTDTADKINYEKAAVIARIAYRLGWWAAAAKEGPHRIEAVEIGARRETPVRAVF